MNSMIEQVDFGKCKITIKYNNLSEEHFHDTRFFYDICAWELYGFLHSYRPDFVEVFKRKDMVYVLVNFNCGFVSQECFRLTYQEFKFFCEYFCSNLFNKSK